MADAKRVDSNSGGLQGVASLLDLLGGQKSSSKTTSDTSALSGILGNLQGTDYEKVLSSIFQQAGGQIPGLTAGLSNSIGARTGGNSAVSTALGKLLESTVMKAADRTAQLQQNNQQLQIQAANGIAQGNKSTSTTSGTNTGKAAQNLAILQLGSKLLNSDTGKGLLSKGKGLFDSVFNQDSSTGADLSSGLNASFDQAPAQFSDAGFNFGGNSDVGFGSLADAGGAAGGFGDLFSSGGGDVVGDAAGSAAGDVAGSFVDYGDFFADGGLVGRDNTPVQYPMGGKTKQPTAQEGSPQAYADGGIVRSGGGRRSSAPTYSPLQSQANAAVQSPRAELNPRREVTLGPLSDFNLESGPGQTSSPAAIGSIDPAQSVAVGNAVGNAVGAATMGAVIGPIGMAAVNATSSLTGISPPQSALSQAISAIAEALGIGGSGVNPDGTSSTSPTATGTSSVADAANADTSDAGNAGTGDGTTSAGDSGDSGTGGAGAGGVGAGDSGTGYRSGGTVSGPGTGTSDSVPANLSKGEYVIPADVVQNLGVRFFDELKNHFHTPAEVQNGR